MNFTYPEIEGDKAEKPELLATETEKPAPDGKKDQDPMRVAAVAISWIMVPLLMPVYGIILILNLSILDNVALLTKFIVTGCIFGINALLPMLLIFLLNRLGVVSDVALNNQRERPLPYIISIIGYLLSALYLWSRGAAPWLWLMFCGGGTTALISLIVNFRWKISAHAAGAAGVVAMLAVVMLKGDPAVPMMPWLFGSMALAGVLGSCRIYLRRHTLAQVLAGYLNGFVPVFALAYFL